jgi:hypothetical protein
VSEAFCTHLLRPKQRTEAILRRRDRRTSIPPPTMIPMTQRWCSKLNIKFNAVQSKFVSGNPIHRAVPFNIGGR